MSICVSLNTDQPAPKYAAVYDDIMAHGNDRLGSTITEKAIRYDIRDS